MVANTVARREAVRLMASPLAAFSSLPSPKSVPSAGSSSVVKVRESTCRYSTLTCAPDGSAGELSSASSGLVALESEDPGDTRALGL